MEEEIKEENMDNIDISNMIDEPKKVYALVRQFHSKKEFLKSKEVLIKFLEKEPVGKLMRMYSARKHRDLSNDRMLL